MKTRVYAELRWSSATRVVVVLVFLAAIVLPAVDHFFHIAPAVALTEKRVLLGYPPLIVPTKKRHSPLTTVADVIRNFPAKFEPAFNDQFGFRSSLVLANNWIKTFVLKVSPTPRIVIGREGWYFLDEARDLLSDFRGKTVVPAADLDAWVQEIEARGAFCRERGIAYLFAIAPNKEDIYSEFLPPTIARLPRGLTRMDQVLRRFQQPQSRVEPIDLRPAIRERKSTGEKLYWKTDTHWTSLGALAGCNEILNRLNARFPEIKPVPRETFPNLERPAFSGDLAEVLGFGGIIPEENVEIDVKGSDRSAGPVDSWMMEYPWCPQCQPRSYDPPRPASSYRLLFCADSFGIAIGRLLAGQFTRVLYLRPPSLFDARFHELLPRVVESERPDILIDLIVERNLEKPPTHIFGR